MRGLPGCEDDIPVVREYQDYVGLDLVEGLDDIMSSGPVVPMAVNTMPRDLLDRFGVKPEECMAFGDSENDIAMLRLCGESYAMANATDDVKAVCRHVAPSNDEAGVMQVLCREFPFLKD